MAKKLRNLKVTSVDLCKQGANQAAHIALKKSAEAGADELMELLGKSVAYAFQDQLADDLQGKMDEINKAMMESEASIEADRTLSDAEKADMLEKSRGEYRDELMSLLKAKRVPDEDEAEDEEASTEESGGESEIDDDKPFLPRKKPRTNKGGKPVKEKEAASTTDMHPEVKKALGEVADMRKELEMGKMREVAKKYEIIGKSVDELSPKLYELMKSGGSNYTEYITLLDEMVECMEKSGIFKEFGSNRSGGLSGDLNQAVAEVMKVRPELSRAEAVVKAYEANPNLSEY